ncbi:5143_t:CDS:2 [Gigaspora rosea]|nr:5143_t:CDS:2 [Gigaspora rosea]
MTRLNRKRKSTQNLPNRRTRQQKSFNTLLHVSEKNKELYTNNFSHDKLDKELYNNNFSQEKSDEELYNNNFSQENLDEELYNSSQDDELINNTFFQGESDKQLYNFSQEESDEHLYNFSQENLDEELYNNFFKNQMNYIIILQILQQILKILPMKLIIHLNFTSAMFFIWITKHMISTLAYNDLIKILQHPQFNIADIVTNIRSLRKWRTNLPLLKVYNHNIQISTKHTPSTSLQYKNAFTISLYDTLEQILNNPKLFSKMYFGSGIESKENKEFWHGKNRLYLEQLLEGYSNIIQQTDVICHISVWLHDQLKPKKYDYEVGEILYKFKIWKIRSIFKRHQLLAETIPTLESAPSNISQFNEIQALSNKSEQQKLATKYGLSLDENILKDIAWNCHLQTPHDIYHAMAGTTIKLLDATMNIFNKSGESEWLNHWKKIEKPTWWPKMPNPLTHRHSFSFSDSLKLAMIMPFILKRFLNIKHIKNTEINILKERLNESHTLIPIKLIECWTTVSKALKITFSKKWYAVNEISELQESDLDNTYTISQESNFTDIILYGKWSIQQVKKANFETKLTITNPLLRDLMNTYSNDLKMPAAIINMRIECYNYITYKILDNDSNYTQIKIHVGDIVEINEVEECQAYAIVKAIFRHKANNGNFYPFLILQWFKYSGYNERYLKCPLYYLQKPDEKKWFKVFPVSYVNKIPKNHFIHACTNSVLEIVVIVTIENI